MARTPFELKGKTVFVAGHRGMVGAALTRRLASENVELLTATRAEVDLRDQAAVLKWFAEKRPQVVFLAAAKVGGIVANNTLRAEFIYDNLAIATNVIGAVTFPPISELQLQTLWKFPRSSSRATMRILSEHAIHASFI